MPKEKLLKALQLKINCKVTFILKYFSSKEFCFLGSSKTYDSYTNIELIDLYYRFLINIHSGDLTSAMFNETHLIERTALKRYLYLNYIVKYYSKGETKLLVEVIDLRVID